MFPRTALRNCEHVFRFSRKNIPTATPTRAFGTKGNGKLSDSPVYELRWYDIHPQGYPDFVALTEDHIHIRLRASPLVGYWYSEIGNPSRENKQTHTHKRKEERRESMSLSYQEVQK